MTDRDGGRDKALSASRREGRLLPLSGWPWKRILQALLGVSALLFFLRWINVWDSLIVLQGMNPWLFVLTCLLGVVGTTLRGGRFYALARAIGAPITLVQSVLANWAASLFAIVTPARAGEGGKVLFFAEKKRLAAGFVFEKLADLGLLLCAGAYGTLVFGRYVNVLLILAALLALGVALLMNLERILSLILRRPVFGGGWLWTTARRIPVRGWVSLGLYTVAIWFLGILAQVAGAGALDLNVPISLMIQVSALSAIAGTLSGTPSGIGTSQWVFTTLLAEVLGVDRAAIGALSLLLLMAATLTALVQGGVGLTLVRLGKAHDWVGEA